MSTNNALEVIDREIRNEHVPGFIAEQLAEARAAFAELIEADREYDAARAEMAANPEPADPQTPEQWAAYSRHLDAKQRLRAAKSRRAAALARAGGAP